MPEDEFAVLEQDPKPNDWQSPVLPAEAIEFLSTVSEAVPRPLLMLDPFDRACLKAARYEIRLGDEAHVGGKAFRLTDENPYLVLPPHQVAVVKTLEVIRMPRFLIGRWNLRVSMVYEGLLWTGALQVDPGWHGNLFCPVYNLADREVNLLFKQTMFTMDFVRVMPTRLEDKRFKPRRRTIGEHDSNRLHSAVYEMRSSFAQMPKRIEDIESQNRAQIEDIQRQSRGQMNLVFTALAVIVTALTILFGAAISTNLDLGTVLGGFALAVSFATFFWMVLFSRRSRNSAVRRDKP